MEHVVRPAPIEPLRLPLRTEFPTPAPAPHAPTHWEEVEAERRRSGQAKGPSRQ